MKKKIIITMMLAALIAVPAFAATVAQDKPQNDQLNQMLKNHQQMMQQAVDNGTITSEQAARMTEHMQQMGPAMQKMMQNGGMMKDMMQNGGMMGNLNNKENNQ